MSELLDALTPRQREFVTGRLPGLRVRADHSWGQLDTVVLEADTADGRVIIKAGGPENHHIERELRAHRNWLRVWTAIDRGPELVLADDEEHLLVTRFVPGVLVEGTDAQQDPGVFRQAGELIALFHGQAEVVDLEWTDRERRRALRWLDSEHRIDPAAERALRAEIAGWTSAPTTLVPTHGDWQPRNWLIDDGVVRAIDLGRADLRPAAEDFSRLAVQDFPRDPSLEQAFLDGYGHDPREGPAWRQIQVGAAIGTAAWAHHVGEERFEQQGHAMIAALLEEPG